MKSKLLSILTVAMMVSVAGAVAFTCTEGAPTADSCVTMDRDSVGKLPYHYNYLAYSDFDVSESVKINITKPVQLMALSTDDVAQIGEQGYATLAKAWSVAIDSPGHVEIKLLKSSSGAGLSLPKDKNHNITLDFNGKSYIATSAVGSTGTENQAMHLEAASSGTDRIILKNGTLASDCSDIDKLIQNYADLDIIDMNLVGPTLKYAMSNNCGDVRIRGNTNIDGKMDVSYWPSAYPAGTHITVDTTGSIKEIEIGFYGKENSIAAPTKSVLTLTNGTVGAMSVYAPDTGTYAFTNITVPALIADANITGSDVPITVDGYKWDNGKLACDDTAKKQTANPVTFDSIAEVSLNGTKKAFVDVKKVDPAADKGYRYLNFVPGDIGLDVGTYTYSIDLTVALSPKGTTAQKVLTTTIKGDLRIVGQEEISKDDVKLGGESCSSAIKVYNGSYVQKSIEMPGVDNDDCDWYAYGLPAGLGITQTGQIAGVPAADVDTYAVNIKATDESGMVYFTDIEIEVLPTGVTVEFKNDCVYSEDNNTFTFYVVSEENDLSINKAVVNGKELTGTDLSCVTVQYFNGADYATQTGDSDLKFNGVGQYRCTLYVDYNGTQAKTTFNINIITIAVGSQSAEANITVQPA